MALPDPPNDPPHRTGTQAISRAALILRQLSTRGRFGWRLSDLADRCGLDRGTTHRILAGLVRERLVQQRRSDHHYLPGPLVFEIAQAMPAYAAFQHACAQPLERLARRFGGLALMHLHSGDDTVCIGRAGESVYVGTAMDLGTRWPLIASAGGVAILIALPPAERERIKASNFARMAARTRTAVKAIEAMIERSQRQGLAFNRGETAAGVHAFALPVRGAGGTVFGSLAIACHAPEVPEARMPEVVEALRAECRLLEAEAAKVME
ncbi:IclR family transcriptional regulator [Pigmentiphaga soli]